MNKGVTGMAKSHYVLSIRSTQKLVVDDMMTLNTLFRATYLACVKISQPACFLSLFMRC